MNLMPCGTNAGYQTHRRNGEEPCGECRRARREYMSERRKEPDKKRRERDLALARERAVWRLAKMHPTTYRALYEEELSKGGVA